LASFVDYDPLRGVETWADGDESNRLQVHYRQDVEPLLDVTRAERNEGASDRRWRKTGMALYARIPPVTILEFKNKYGLDVFNKNHMPRIMTLINTEYPYLKCTEMTHTVRAND
jgi:hypothetical protein